MVINLILELMTCKDTPAVNEAKESTLPYLTRLNYLMPGSYAEKWPIIVSEDGR